jgi:hypothetical protein
MEPRQTKTKKTKATLVALCACVLGLTAGCEDALRDGLDDGISAALSAIIEAPVNYVLDQAFSEP